MRAVSKPNFATLVAVLFATTLLVRAEDQKALQQKLESKYTITIINAEGGVVTPGVTLVLKKSGLTAGAKSACTNEYNDGRIALAGISKVSCGVRKSRFGLPGAVGGAPARGFVVGEKLYLTKIEIKETIVFHLISDVIGDDAYKAQVKFPAVALDFGQVDQLIGELFSIAPANDQQQSGGTQGAQQAQQPQQAQQQAPPPAPLPALVPPPPPPDQGAAAPAAAPQSVSLGMTPAQVTAIKGQPTSITDLGAKKIYNYPGLKITFMNGKLTDAQ